MPLTSTESGSRHLGEIADPLVGRGAHEDLAADGGALHARGDVDGAPHHRVLGALLGPDVADHGLAGVQPMPISRRGSPRVAWAALISAMAPCMARAAAGRALGVVGVRERRAEDGEDRRRR